MKNKLFDKVVIWGHKLETFHTHSHIHSSYFIAFRHMGFPTYWFDNLDMASGKLENFDFNRTLFFTEDQVMSLMPATKDAVYILHSRRTHPYDQLSNKVFHLYNYVKECENGISYEYASENATVEKIDDFFFYDEKNKAIYQPWATDLLPSEIKILQPVLYNKDIDTINYVGSIWSVNNSRINEFIVACHDNNKHFVPHRRVGDIAHRTLIRESYIAPDLRGEDHIKHGYLPCRIFKNMSYGKPTATNSLHIWDAFEGRVAFEPDAYNLYHVAEKAYRDANYKQIREGMFYIAENHTYLNRIRNILYIVENY